VRRTLGTFMDPNVKFVADKRGLQDFPIDTEV